MDALRQKTNHTTTCYLPRTRLLLVGGGGALEIYVFLPGETFRYLRINTEEKNNQYSSFIDE